MLTPPNKTDVIWIRENVGESNSLRNPADTHTTKVFNPSIRGHTDQFVYVFQRP